MILEGFYLSACLVLRCRVELGVHIYPYGQASGTRGILTLRYEVDRKTGRLEQTR